MEQTSSPLDEPELEAWGRRIGEEAEPPLVLALRGDLGAGKTTLARAIARGAGVEGPVPSPTYNLLFRYATAREIELAHLDLYRLQHPEEVWELGWSELPGERDVMLIEWPERAEALLPEPRWEVRLEESAPGDLRRVTLEPIGSPTPLPPLP